MRSKRHVRSWRELGDRRCYLQEKLGEIRGDTWGTDRLQLGFGDCWFAARGGIAQKKVVSGVECGTVAGFRGLR